jgi:DNA-binding transcriptional regulator YiaG
MTKHREYYFIKGREMLPEPYHLTAVGLPNIWLLNGVTFEDDPDYGQLVTIQKLSGLHRAIGLRIIEKSELMSGPELRFLRKQLGLTQAALAHKVQLTDQTIANYEKGVTEISGPADALLKLTYMISLVPDDTEARVVKSAMPTANDDERPPRLPPLTRFKIVQGWEERLAA